MKKKIMILAVAVASMAGFSTYAQQLSATATSGVQTEKYVKNGKVECAKDACKGGNAFEGITLTPDQQTKIDALKADCKANREKCKADKKAAKEQARADRKQAKRDYLNKVKGILTPDQYVVFLENIVVSDGPRDGMRPGGHHGGKQFKGGKDMKRGAGQRAPKTAEVAK